MYTKSQFVRVVMPLLVVAALLGGTSSAVAAERPAKPASELTYVGKALIVNKFSPDGKRYCLDAHVSSGGALNSKVGLWECNGVRR